MQLKELAQTGRKIPEVGLGTWGYAGGPAPLQAGLDAGAGFIDTAESYGSEPVVADAIHDRREQVFLATKVSPAHFRRADLLKAADESLRRLRTDWIDLYQLHRPNPKIPLAETLGALAELVAAGKIRFIGVSNFNLALLQHARQLLGKHPIVSNQIRYNLVDRTIEKDLLPYCHQQGITVIAYSPLCRDAQRLLDGDPRGVLRELAAATGKTAAQVALNWCLSRERVVVIPKGSSAAHVRENCGASDWRLTAEQLQRLDEEIVFRRRGTIESILRRCVPGRLVQPLRRLAAALPPALRRPFN